MQNDCPELRCEQDARPDTWKKGKARGGRGVVKLKQLDTSEDYVCSGEGMGKNRATKEGRKGREKGRKGMRQKKFKLYLHEYGGGWWLWKDWDNNTSRIS